MDADKLSKNFEKLRKQIARKPPEYTREYAIRISESFSKYTRTSTINLLLATNEALKERRWSFPFYFPRTPWEDRKVPNLLALSALYGIFDTLHKLWIWSINSYFSET